MAIATRPRGRAASPASRDEPRAEAARDRNADAGAVAGAIVGRPGATVSEGGKRLECHRHGAGGVAPVQVGHEADAAGVVLVPWVVERRVDRLKWLDGHRSSSPLRGVSPTLGAVGRDVRASAVPGA